MSRGSFSQYVFLPRESKRSVFQRRSWSNSDGTRLSPAEGKTSVVMSEKSRWRRLR